MTNPQSRNGAGGAFPLSHFCTTVVSRHQYAFGPLFPMTDTATHSDDLALSAPFPRPPRTITAWLAPVAVGLALLSALVTFLVLTGLTPVAPTHDVVVTVLLANAVTGVLLMVVVVWQVVGLIRARRKGRAAARLHVRIVLMFALVAIVPAILVAVIASITLDRGLDRWFSTRTRAIIDSSVTIAETYVREHALGIRADLVAMAAEIGRAS